MQASPDRLDRIEAILEQTAQRVDSNARSIQALGDRIAEVTNDIAELKEIQAEAQEERRELRQATLGIANLVASLDEDRPTIFQKLNSIERKVDRLHGQEQ